MSGDNWSTTLTNWFSPSSAPTAAQAKTAGAMGNMFMLAGAIQGIVGTYYSAKTQKYQLESQRLSYEYKQQMAELNARQMELQAQNILLAGERQIGAVTMRAGKIKSASKASMAARGIVLGVGNAAEQIATIDLMKETDALTINANATQAAWAARIRGTGFTAEGMMAGVSAFGAGAAASQVSPFGQAATSLLGSATQYAQSWYQSNRYNQLVSALGG